MTSSSFVDHSDNSGNDELCVDRMWFSYLYVGEISSELIKSSVLLSIKIFIFSIGRLFLVFVSFVIYVSFQYY